MENIGEETTPREQSTAEPVTELVAVQEPEATPQTARTMKTLDSPASDYNEGQFPKGWRLYTSTLGVLICIFLVNVEVTIVSTSLVTIVNDFHSFNRTSWIVTGYLITYTGFNILWSKLSDIIGRKTSIISTMAVFMSFSLGCGMAKSMSQLIIFRAFQGMGAAGLYSISVILCYEMVPKPSLPAMGALASLATALGFSTGPLFGGVLGDHGIWRWIFYMNLPICGLAMLLLLVALPSNFDGSGRRRTTRITSWSNLRRIDVVGALILLTATLPLITALNEVYVQFRWSDGRTVILLAISGVSWYAFLAWEHVMTTREGPGPEPIFPSRFLNQANWMGMILTSFLVGMPSSMVVVMLPQRFQIVNGTSALSAGIRLLAYSSTSAVSAGLSGIVAKKARVPFIYSLAFGALLHAAGVALLSTLPQTKNFSWGGYVYEGLAGAGVGTTFGLLVLATPFVVEPRDVAVAAGAIIQFRFLGGAIGLSIASNIQNGMLEHRLSNVLTPLQLQSLLHNTAFIETLPDSQRIVVQGVFADSYTTQFRIMTGIAAAQFPASLLLYNRGGRQINALE